MESNENQNVKSGRRFRIVDEWRNVHATAEDGQNVKTCENIKAEKNRLKFHVIRHAAPASRQKTRRTNKRNIVIVSHDSRKGLWKIKRRAWIANYTVNN